MKSAPGTPTSRGPIVVQAGLRASQRMATT